MKHHRLSRLSASAAAVSFYSFLPVACDENSTKKEYDAWAKKVKLKEELPVLARAKKGGRISLLWDTLYGPDKLEELRMWQQTRNDPYEGPENDAVAGKTHMRTLMRLGGAEICGHPDLIHGGFTSAILDEMFGWATFAERNALFGAKSQALIFTANLDVNYRRPMLCYSNYLIDVKVTKVVRSKKIYLEATITDKEGNVCIESTALYIIKQQPPEDASQASNAVDYGSAVDAATE
jgi:acyl-coenzyme A thioesterase PaaI-like protein